MKKLTLSGPFSFFEPGPTIDQIGPGANGIYLWCVAGNDGTHRLHYVGESFDVAMRLRGHRKAQLLGQYVAFDPDALRNNIKILMHRARKGMVAKYSGLDRSEFNRVYLSAISVFYADLGPEADKGLRCRYEHALYVAVEDHGQNILCVGHLRSSASEPSEVIVDTPGATIEALTDAVLRV